MLDLSSNSKLKTVPQATVVYMLLPVLASCFNTSTYMTLHDISIKLIKKSDCVPKNDAGGSEKLRIFFPGLKQISLATKLTMDIQLEADFLIEYLWSKFSCPASALQSNSVHTTVPALNSGHI